MNRRGIGRFERVLIQVGPARQSGGIADVMQAIERWSRASGRPVRTVNTSCDGPLAARASAGVAGVARALARIAAQPESLVHVHMASNGSFLRKSTVVIAAHALRRPIVLQIHGGGFAAFATGGSAVRKRCVRHVLGLADVVLVLNEASRRAMGALQPNAPIEIVPNPATLLCGTLTDPASRQILFLGRLGHIKGTDVLLEAIRALQAAGVDADYVLAGDGDIKRTREVVSSLPAPQRVRVPGWVRGDDVHILLHESSVFCLPSRYEGLPMALLQAMGHGLACVVTPIGGMRDIIDSGENGMLIPVDDSQTLARVLGSLLVDAPERARLGRGAAETIQAGYTPDVVMRRLDEIYSTMWAGEGHHGGA